ncbi:restriction endonuclease subunit S [Halovivax cerinus]|uniref:Restriction endonuclease subunit S n=1 Tax=Halovivax cerinus TaxID=1487865 RepID=A0ABD5NNB9_9EURY|nr:restriction endonuclease subunit S [Halovivax cerinus]
MSRTTSEAKRVLLNSREIEIPADWDVVTVGDVSQKTKGKKPDALYDNPAQDRLPYLTIAASQGEVSQWANSEDGKRASDDHILMVWDGASSGTVFKSFEGIIGSTLAAFEFDEGDLDSDFAYYSLSHHEDRISELSEGTGITHVPRDFTQIFQILKPPLLEQRRIAGILSKVDDQIKLTNDIIKKVEELEKGLLQNLFKLFFEQDCKTIQLGPFSVTIPSHWSVEMLDDLNKDEYPICYGVLKPGDYHADGVQLLNIEDITDTGEVLSDSVHRISEELHEQYSRSEIQGGEVVVSVKGTVGRVVHLNDDIEKSNISRDLARITPTERLDPRWLRYCLSTKIYKDLIEVYSTGSTRASLNIGDLREIPVVCPPISEQLEISDVIETLESTLECERYRKQKLQSLKHGLMQDLLTGKVRVNDITVEDS